MKLTEQKLKQIILEELQNINEDDKVQSDVEMILKILPRINNAQKYYQTMKALLNHELNQSHKRKALLELKPLYLEKLQGKEEAPTQNPEAQPPQQEPVEK